MAYEKSREEASRIGQILSEGRELPSDVAQSSVNNLVRSSLNSFMSLMEQQDAQVRKCLNEGEVVDEEYQTQLEATTKLVRQVELACFKQDLRDTGRQIDLQKPLLTELYDVTDPIYNESKIKLSDARAVTEFTADTVPTDLKAEEFLAQVVITGRQAKLNEVGLRTLLMSKLAGPARQIVISHLQLHGLKLDDLSFKDLVALCEHNFCPNSHPRQANLQLQSLPKLAPGDNSFLKLMSTVTRLAKISTLEVDEEHRDILFQSRALDAFLNCLQQKHKALIVTENHKRHQSGLAHFTLAGATDFLVQHATQLDSTLQSNILYNSTVNRVGQEYSEDDTFVPEQDEFGYFVARGRSRARSRFETSRPQRRPWNRGSPHSPGNRGQNDQNFRGRAFSNERGNYRNEFAPDRGYYQRGSRGFPRRNERYSNRSRGFNPARGGYERKPSLNHSYGIARNRCYACGLEHSYLDDSCQYFGLPLQASACRNCSTGLHPTSKCLGNIQQAQQAYRKEVAAEKAAGLTPGGAYRGGGRPSRGRFVYDDDPSTAQSAGGDKRSDLEAYLEEIEEEN